MALAPALNSGFLGVDQSALGRRWELRSVDDAVARDLVQNAGVSDAVARVLAGRGVDISSASTFLKPTLKTLLPDPSSIADVDKAALRILRALQADEQIAVFGDYDVDGATSSALLKLFFRAIDKDIEVYIPDRQAEGYGPNTAALKKLRERGNKVVITVDCGIVAFDTLRTANEDGLDVIVVDHHKAEPELPIAAAVINPNRLDDESGLGHLAAVGVTFMLIVAVNRLLRDQRYYAENNLPEPDLKQWLDIVALGTVCDVVPLKGLNRALVTQGLQIMAQQNNVGLAALSRIARVDERPTAFHLGYLLGPRVNAGGRVGQADIGTRLLSTDDADEAAALALKLDEFNASRKEIEAAVLGEAIEQVETTANPDDPVLFAVGKDWHPGVIGIVAGRLKERYDRPACVVALDGGMAKGSGRSVAGVDLGRAVLAARDAGLLFNGGGHAMAAGFTVEEARLKDFSNFLSEHVRHQLQGEPIAPQLDIDGAVAASAVNIHLVSELECIAPFGAGNDEPRFVITDVKVGKADVVGSGHVRCFFSGRSGGNVKGIAFNCADSELGHLLLTSGDRRIHVAGTIRADNWQGRRGVQIVIDDAALLQ